MSEEKTIRVCIEIGENTASDLADLLCWWEGFKIGIKTGGGIDHFIVAENGIEAARKLNVEIKKEIKRLSE